MSKQRIELSVTLCVVLQLSMILAAVDTGIVYFNRFNGSLLSCTSRPTLTNVSVFHCVTHCLSLAGDKCIGFNYNELTREDDNNVDDANGGSSCSPCVLSKHNNILVNFPNEKRHFYWLRRSTMLREVPLEEFIPVPNGMHAGRVIAVYGVLKDIISIFKISFVDSAKDLIPLRFRAMFSDKYNGWVTVVKSLFSTGWGKSMNVKYPSPYKLHTEFELVFFVNAESYSIYVNGIFMMDYPVYGSLDDIGYMYISKALHINGIVFG